MTPVARTGAEPSARFDYIIVGGGSAGCVLANRLSARSGNKVLLCEAGPDVAPGKVPPEIADSYAGTVYGDVRYHWAGLMAATQPIPHNEAARPDPALYRKYIQPRVLGGGSSINGQLANRGAPEDYDAWERMGAAGWNWRSVLPYFRKLETDLDCDGPLHGASGPIAIRRVPAEHWSGHARAAADAFAQSGYEFLPDQNGPFREGWFPIAISNESERRVTAATAYLPNDVRARPNLTILTGAEVLRLRMEGRVCIGVDALVRGRAVSFAATEIILAAGAVFSPAHLMRAGIGPAMHLRDQGIDVLTARAGVGQRLMDHPSVALGSFLRRPARMNRRSRRHMQVGLRYSSGIGDLPLDMFIGTVSKTAWHKVGEQIAAFAIMVSGPSSEAGEVRLASADPARQPLVNFNLLSDRRDLERLKDGFRRAVAFQQLAAMREATRESFPASYSERLLQFGAVTLRNRVTMALAGLLLDGPAVLRKALTDRMIVGDYTLAQVLADDGCLEDFVRGSAMGAWHPCCTCRMGDESDPMAVTDRQGRVHGVAGLRVVDASIFPRIPRANTNLPAMMVAEKISDAILQDKSED